MSEIETTPGARSAAPSATFAFTGFFTGSCFHSGPLKSSLISLQNHSSHCITSCIVRRQSSSWRA